MATGKQELKKLFDAPCPSVLLVGALSQEVGPGIPKADRKNWARKRLSYAQMQVASLAWPQLPHFCSVFEYQPNSRKEFQPTKSAHLLLGCLLLRILSWVKWFQGPNQVQHGSTWFNMVQQGNHQTQLPALLPGSSLTFGASASFCIFLSQSLWLAAACLASTWAVFFASPFTGTSTKFFQLPSMRRVWIRCPFCAG